MASRLVLDRGQAPRAERRAVPAGIGDQGIETGHAELRGIERIGRVHNLEELVAEPGEPRRRLLGTCRGLVSHALTLRFLRATAAAGQATACHDP